METRWLTFVIVLSRYHNEQQRNQCRPPHGIKRHVLSLPIRHQGSFKQEKGFGASFGSQKPAFLGRDAVFRNSGTLIPYPCDNSGRLYSLNFNGGRRDHVNSCRRYLVPPLWKRPISARVTFRLGFDTCAVGFERF